MGLKTEIKAKKNFRVDIGVDLRFGINAHTRNARENGELEWMELRFIKTFQEGLKRKRICTRGKGTN